MSLVKELQERHGYTDHLVDQEKYLSKPIDTKGTQFLIKIISDNELDSPQVSFLSKELENSLFEDVERLTNNIEEIQDYYLQAIKYIKLRG
ncbi:MAG: hypothetical protein HRT72_04700 [Flavobacteriales bacterium]|nr:hypothetical protein [Flavobacteriales bacterium]